MSIKKSTYVPVLRKTMTERSAGRKTMTNVRERLSWKSDDRAAGNGFNQDALANNNSFLRKINICRRADSERREISQTRI